MTFSPKQTLSIREANQKINLWIGSVRSGKSHAALHAFLYFIRKGPPGPLLITGRSTNTIERNVVEPIRDLVGSYAKYKRGVGELDLFGRTIYVVGAADERSEGRIRGSTFVGALVDEVTILPESFFKMLLSRLSLPGAQLFGTSNPDSPHHWLKKDFLDHKDNLPLASWDFYLEDNPSLSHEYITDLKKFYQGLWYSRFIEGKWVMAEGAIYDFFDETIHVIAAPPSYAKYYVVGIDYGTTNPFAATMIGFNDDVQPSLWVEREYYYNCKDYNAGKTDAEYARDMQRWLSDYPVKALYIDPSAASFRLEIKRLLPRQLIKDANNDVLNGIRSVANNLSQGTLKICAECKHLIREMQSYCWDEKASRLGKEAPVKANDHLCVAGSTQILTPDGWCSIQKMKQYGNLINFNITAQKSECDEFKNLSLTQRNAEIFELELEDGKMLRATGDHQVLTTRGYVALRSLTPSDTVIVCNIKNILEKGST